MLEIISKIILSEKQGEVLKWKRELEVAIKSFLTEINKVLNELEEEVNENKKEDFIKNIETNFKNLKESILDKDNDLKKNYEKNILEILIFIKQEALEKIDNN